MEIQSTSLAVEESAALPFEQGLVYLRAGSLDEAIECLGRARLREPGRFAIVRALATSYLLTHQPDAAREIIDQLIHDQPMLDEAWRLAAQLEWKLGDTRRAIERLQTGLRRLPRSEILQEQIALFEAALGSATALPIRSIPKLPTTDPDWLDQIAADPGLLRAALEAVDHEDASPGVFADTMRSLESRLQALVKMQPMHADRLLMLAQLQGKLGENKDAMVTVEQALHINASLPRAQRLQAQLLAREGQTDAALKILHHLTKQGLHWPDLHREIAALEGRNQPVSDDFTHLDSAVSPNPQLECEKVRIMRIAA